MNVRTKTERETWAFLRVLPWIYIVRQQENKSGVAPKVHYLNKVQQLGTRSTSDSNNLNMIKQSKMARKNEAGSYLTYL